jgi:hypothetical protein
MTVQDASRMRRVFASRTAILKIHSSVSFIGLPHTR